MINLYLHFKRSPSDTHLAVSHTHPPPQNSPGNGLPKKRTGGWVGGGIILALSPLLLDSVHCERVWPGNSHLLAFPPLGW